MFSIKDFFRKVGIWSHLLKKSLMENFIFCAGFGIIKIEGDIEEKYFKTTSSFSQVSTCIFRKFPNLAN